MAGKDVSAILRDMSREERVRALVFYALLKTGRVSRRDSLEVVTEAVESALTRWRWRPRRIT